METTTTIKKLLSRKLFLIFLLTTASMNAQQHTEPNQSLNPQEQSLAAISALTAVGNMEQLKLQLAVGLENGLTINEIKEALTQLYAYCGFPRSLNSINAFKSVLDERKSKGINDKEGKKIIVENPSADKYEQGRKVLEALTKTPQTRPAPGFGEFAPRIDAFLKEHLFADIFSSDVLSVQQREIVTIAALAATPGVEPQLLAHIHMGKNTGLTENQLQDIAAIIEKHVNHVQANILRNSIGTPQTPTAETDLMVRLSEIEISQEYLNEYLTILKEEAAASIELEPGVVAIFPMYVQDQPTILRIVEIYASRNAYLSHLESPHFKKYKSSTLSMVKNLKLIDMKSIDVATMKAIFKKM